MKISGINAASSYGYSRLKKVFVSGQNYNNYEKIVSTAKNKIIGNIPNELIQIIIKNFPNQKASKIKEIQKTFSDVSETLKLVQKTEFDYANGTKGLQSIIDFITKSTSKTLVSPKSHTLVEHAEQQLTKGLREILPEGSKLSINYIGQGAFCNAFKIQFKGKNGENLLHDRVLKVYKDQEIFKQTKLVRDRMFKHIFANFSNKEILGLLREKHLFNEHDDKILMNRIKKIRADVETGISEENLNELFKNRNRRIAPIHGVYAEANSALRLKHILGHRLSKTNIIDYDMFDLEHGFAITKFSNKNSPKITSKIDFDKLGLVATDFSPKNIIRGRLVDFGGIKYSEIFPWLNDNNVIKFYKKIINRKNLKERQALINHYQELIKNPKTPLRDKIEKAVKLATNSELFKQ